jgi:hypothetical protein
VFVKGAAAAALIGVLQIWNMLAPPSAPSRFQVSQCLAAEEASVVRVRADAVFFCGRISEASLALLRDAIQPTDRALLIASFGGELDAPIELGEMVRDRRLTLEVVGPCLSGCAAFVFVAAQRRVIAPGGVLGLHNTASSAMVLARALDLVTDEDRPLVERSHREVALYDSVGVDPNLLLEPQVRLDTLCLEVGSPDRRTGETRFLLHTRHSLWAPTRAQWQAFGVAFSGASPTSRAHAQRLLDTATPGSLNSGATLTLNSMALPAPPEVYLADVPRCARRERG